MPLFESKEKRDARQEADEAAARVRGVLVVVESANNVPRLVESYSDRGWVLDSIMYAGEGLQTTAFKYAAQTVVFRWPTEPSPAAPRSIS